jgi:MFS family permease
MRSARNLLLLCACQALLYVNNVTLIVINGLAGYALATNKSLATLPVSTYIVGSALATLPASFFMQRFGRKAGFTLGSAFGAAGTGVCTAAVLMQSFWGLCIGTWIVGAYNAFAQQYRFAAAESSPPDARARAIALVLAGGIIGGLVGPEAAKLTKDTFALEFTGTYASLALVALVSMLLVQGLRLHDTTAGARAERPRGRSLRELAAQPAFVVAVVGATLGYGVMNLLMTATPLAMGHHDHGFGATALVIEWHVVGMFAPGFVTGNLIRRFGVLNVMLAGAILQLLCVVVALLGTSVAHFWIALFLLGAGWNFLYVGGTTLLTGSHRPEERAKAQGFNDFCVFTTMAISSFASGLLLHATGWTLLNLISLPFVVLAAVAIGWFARTRRAAARQPV